MNWPTLHRTADKSINFVPTPMPPVLDPAQVDPATVRECGDVTGREPYAGSPSVAELVAAGRAERARRTILERHPDYDPGRAAALQRILNERYGRTGGAA
jgi:hypothetical protein